MTWEFTTAFDLWERLGMANVTKIQPHSCLKEPHPHPSLPLEGEGENHLSFSSGLPTSLLSLIFVEDAEHFGVFVQCHKSSPDDGCSRWSSIFSLQITAKLCNPEYGFCQ
jgi:hypothetical protein